ncbi:hypothetical protein, partial [Streptobacillus moniliformis]|uniref:hypothetical protein n=1 Tax=Streptobacillus moniliformis TaxID=34105 RepID=UPI001E397A70
LTYLTLNIKCSKPISNSYTKVINIFLYSYLSLNTLLESISNSILPNFLKFNPKDKYVSSPFSSAPI